MVEKLVFGGASLTSVGSIREIMKILNFAHDLGIRHYDTAPLYGQGYSEIIYGKFISDKRDSLTITTKFGYGNANNSNPYLLTPLLLANYWRKKLVSAHGKLDATSINKGLIQRKIQKKEVELSFLKSVKSLKTNYIDNFLLHEGIPSFLSDEAFQYLLNLRQNGDVLKLGIATNVYSLIELDVREVSQWDILQYEGFNTELKANLKKVYPDKEHVHHSCLLKKNEHDFNKVSAPELLSRSVLENYDGKVIFSSRKISRIRNNVMEISKLISR